MRNYVVRYTDPIIGREGEIYESEPFEGRKASGMKEALEMLGCKVVDIREYKERSSECL